MAKNSLNPHVILSYDVDSYLGVCIVVTSSSGTILCLANKPIVRDNYLTRKAVISCIKQLVSKYNVDTIMFEQNKLFLDKIDRFPYPYVLQNVMLRYSIQVTLEDLYYDTRVLISLPEYEWKNAVLNRKVNYSIDLYKAHIKYRTDIPMKTLIQINEGNYHKVVCFSESVMSDSLMNKKYQLNKEIKVE